MDHVTTSNRETGARAGTTRASARRSGISEEERDRMIAEAAYYRAERRGFVGGDPVRDWIEARAEIDGMIAGRSARSAKRGR